MSRSNNQKPAAGTSAGDPPPFAFEAKSRAFESRLWEEVPRRLNVLQTQLIPGRNMLNYAHGAGWTCHSTQGDEVRGEFQLQSDEFRFNATDLLDCDLQKLVAMLDSMVRKMAAGTEMRLIQSVEAVTNRTGNVVDWDPKAKNAPAVFCELLRKVEFGVDEKGEPSLPCFYNPSPAFLAEIQDYLRANPGYRAEVDALKKTKMEEARAREAQRKARFRRHP